MSEFDLFNQVDSISGQLDFPNSLIANLDGGDAVFDAGGVGAYSTAVVGGLDDSSFNVSTVAPPFYALAYIMKL